MIIDEIKSIKSGKGELKKFGLTVGVVFAIIGGLLFWRGREYYYYFVILSSILIIPALFLPVLLKPFHMFWMSFAIVMGWVITRVILIILFYLVLTPIGIFARLVGKDFLDIKFDPNKHSYWIPKEEKKRDKITYEKQF